MATGMLQLWDALASPREPQQLPQMKAGLRKKPPEPPGLGKEHTEGHQHVPNTGRSLGATAVPWFQAGLKGSQPPFAVFISHPATC